MNNIDTSKDYAKCNDCPERLVTKDDAIAHREATSFANSGGWSHTTTILNHTQDEIRVMNAESSLENHIDALMERIYWDLERVENYDKDHKDYFDKSDVEKAFQNYDLESYWVEYAGSEED